MFYRKFFPFAAACAAVLFSAAVNTHALTIDVKEFSLDNGMLFLVVERDTVPQVACRLSIRAGSALEDTGRSGIAHMLEHMMFKGTMNFGTLDPDRDRELQERIESAYQVVLQEKRSRHPDWELIRRKRGKMAQLRREVQEIFVPQAFSSQLEKNGAVGVNAFTSHDETQYMVSVPSDMLEQWFSIVSEQIFEPAWREFYVEKEVVQREWAFRYVNNPAGAAWLDLYANAFTAHPYRNPVIGWRSDMDYYNATDAREFHREHYNPSNAVAVLVGDVKVEEVRRLAEIYFSRYPAGSRSPEKVTAEPQQKGPRKSIRYLEGARSPLLRIAFHGAPMESEDYYALDALAMVLSHGRSARLTREIIQKGLAVEAWAHNPGQRFGGMFILGGSPNDPERPDGLQPDQQGERELNLEACRNLKDLLLDQVDRLIRKPVTEAELARVLKLNERAFLDKLRNNENLARSLSTLEVKTGWRHLVEYVDRISRVTPEDIRRVAIDYLHRDNMTVVYVLPGGEPDKPPEPYEEERSSVGRRPARMHQADATMENNSRYPTPEGWRHPLSFERSPQVIDYPDAERMKASGVEVFFLEDGELPLVDLTILVKAGRVDVPEEKQGLAEVLSHSLVRGGTWDMTPDMLAEKMDEMAMRLSVSIGEEESTIRLSVMNDDWEEGLSLLGDILTRPGFDSAVLDSVRRQLVTALVRRGEDARAVAMREALIRHFKGHPYGVDPLAALEIIPKIGSDDLKSFLQDYFVPSNMVAAVAGDISMDRVRDGLANVFSELPEGPPSDRNIPEPEKSSPVVAFIDKPGQVQAHVAMMLPSFPRSHPDYWKTGLLVNLFGGRDSMLYSRLRDDLGLVYAAYAHQTFRWEAGFVVGYAGCRADRTVEVIEEAMELMKELHKGVSPEKLENKRMDVLNSFVFNVDSPKELVTVYGRYRLRGEPLDTLDRIQRDYLSATAEDLERLAGVVLDPAALQVFVVADRNTVVRGEDGTETILGQKLRLFAEKAGLPFEEIELR